MSKSLLLAIAFLVANTSFAQMSVTITSGNVMCNGGTTGHATALSTGGVGPYSFIWSYNSQTTMTITGLTAGIYSVTATDAVGTVAIDSVLITEPTPIILNPQILSNFNGAAISCNGSSDGEVGVTAVGGTGLTYTYLWSPLGQNTANINGLFAGTYCVTVNDVAGCQADTCITISDPVPLSATSNHVDLFCAGSANGQILVNATPGTGTLGVNGYEYKITGPGQTGSVYSSINAYSNLVAGAYDVFVRDGNACNIQLSIQITEPDSVLIDSVVVVDALCFGTATGTATVYNRGGTGNSYYIWSGGANGQTTQMATGLTIGLYTVTVVDDNGCERVENFNLGEATSLVGSVNAGTISCIGGVTTATVSASGGTPVSNTTYLYNWSNGITGAMTIGLTAGFHCVTITDSYACTMEECITITEPSAGVSAVISAHTDVLCQGTATGAATVQGVGGTAPYTYLWQLSPIQSSQTVTALTAGVYTVSVTDTNGCPVSTTVTITEPSALAATFTSTNIQCKGAADGQIIVTATGGTLGNGYEYKIAGPGQTPVYDTINVFSNLNTGAYDLFVRDANGCNVQLAIQITEPDLVTLDSISLVDNTCEGTAMAYASGGVSNFTYHWSHDTTLTTQTVVGLTVGNYTVTVADGNGCTVDTNFTITQAINPISAYLTSADALCYGSSSAEMGAVVQGGSGNYTYLWNTNPTQSTVVADSLLAGSYTVTIIDVGTGCTVVSTGFVGQATLLQVTATVQQQVSCFQGSNGVAIGNTATGGTPSYSYMWTDPNSQSTQVATNLMPGEVSVIVTDNNACTATASVTITEAAEMTVTPTINHVSCNGASDGSIVIYSSSIIINYIWNAGFGNPLMGLAAGTYDLTVMNNVGCTENFSFVVTEPDSLGINIIDNNNGTVTASPTGGTAPYTYLWDGAANNQTTATATGLIDSVNYSVTVTDSCQNVAVIGLRVGIEQISSLERFDLYPNPNAGVFYLDVLFRQEETGVIEIRDVLGRLVFSKSFREHEVHQEIKLDKASAGMYFLSLKVGGQVITKKVQIE